MTSEPEPITSAGLFPPASVLERFASYFPPSTPFSYILTRLHELSQMHSRFHLCGLKDQVWVADLIEPIKGLTIVDRNIITSSPAGKSDIELWRTLMPRYARCIAEQSGGDLADIEELPLEILDAEVSANREYLRALEQLHKGIVTYLWLSYRFAGIFTSRSLAFHTKGLVEEKIEAVLGQFAFSEITRKKIAAKKEQELLAEMEGAFGEKVENGVESDVEDVKVMEDLESERVFSGQSSGAGRSGAEQESPMTLGGDRFGGEEEIPFEDPTQADVVGAEGGEAAQVSSVESGSAVDNFAQWRQQETKPDGRSSSSATMSDVDAPIAAAVTEGEDAARHIAANEQLFDVDRPDMPSVGDVLQHDNTTEPSAQLTEVAEEEAGMSPEQDPTIIHAAATPETELDSDIRTPPEETAVPAMESQAGPTTPAAGEGLDSVEQTPPRAARHDEFVPAMPPKHLHTHLDADVKELGTDAGSRP